MPQKLFYELKDFYNFIKTNRDNAITNQRFFSVVCYPQAVGSDIYSGLCATSGIFYDEYLQRFSMSIQKIELPNFCMSANGVESSLEINTPIGAWRGINNTTKFVSGNEIKFHILELQNPVIETWLYKWYGRCLQTNIDIGTRPYPFPRLNMAIKYYRTDDFSFGSSDKKDTKKIYPKFIYYIEGAYPDDLETYKFDHSEADSGSIMRSVTFAFNMMTCYLNENDEKTAVGTEVIDSYHSGKYR